MDGLVEFQMCFEEDFIWIKVGCEFAHYSHMSSRVSPVCIVRIVVILLHVLTSSDAGHEEEEKEEEEYPFPKSIGNVVPHLVVK